MKNKTQNYSLDYDDVPRLISTDEKLQIEVRYGPDGPFISFRLNKRKFSLDTKSSQLLVKMYNEISMGV